MIRLFGRNNFQGRCLVCGGRIGPEQGYAGLVDGLRALWCSTHKPSEEEMNPASAEAPGVYFDLAADGQMFDLLLRGRHPREAFDTYLRVKRESGVRSARVGDRWQDTCTIPMAGRVWKALTDAGFSVAASPRAAAAMQGAAAQQQADDTAVQARLTHPRAANLFDFQRTGVQWLSSRTGALLADEMGCIDGEAEVWVTRAGHEGALTLDMLEMHFNGRGHVEAWDRAIPVKVRALVDGVIRYHTVKAVLDKGHRAVVKLTLESGKTLRLTPDHEVGCWGDVWTPAEQLQRGDEVLTRDSNFVNTLPRGERVVSVVPDGHARVFDIVMDDPHRNFVANGIVVHNCGKTIQALMAIGDKRPVLLVVPASLKLNWRNEAAKWRPEYKVEVLKGRGNFRYPRPGEIVVINYDILPRALPRLEYGRMPPLSGEFVQPPDRLIVIADEAHSVKNAKAQRTENFRFLGDIARNVGGQVWLLTGTPLLNRPAELWSVFTSGGLAKEAFGSFDRFKDLFNARQGRFGIEWGEPSPMVAECIRRVQLRREKKDVLRDLPSKMRKQVPIDVEDVSARDRRLFDSTMQELERLERQRSTASGRQAITKEAASEIAAFPQFTEFSQALTALALAKTEATTEYIKAFIAGDESRGYAGETTPFLVFSAHVEPLRKVKKAVEDAGLKCGIITGEVSSEDRTQVVSDFQSGRLDCVCISIKAGGVGLTLTRATHSVFIDLEVVPALNVQAEDRIHRIGQTLPVTIHQMVLDHPLDRHVNALVLKKMELFETTVGASTFLPTDTVAPNANASATVQAAAQIVVAAPTRGRPDQRPATQVRTVEYTRGDERRRVTVPEQARPARSAREVWAARAIATLTDYDPDRASERNYAGWNAGDGSAGHMFNALIRGGYGLTDSQWDEALAMLGKYHAQVGRAPAAEPAEERRATRRNASQPAQVGPPAAPDAPAPVAAAAQGVGRIGSYAVGEVTCLSLPRQQGATIVPATFATSDNRVVRATGGIDLPSGALLEQNGIYRVRFQVTAHEPVQGRVVTVAGPMQVLAQTRRGLVAPAAARARR